MNRKGGLTESRRRGDHVAVKQLVEHFARYLYLPRLRDPGVLLGAIRDGVSLLTWERESFAFADSFDEAKGRYRGLRGGQIVSLIDAGAPGLLVKPEVARRQLDREEQERAGSNTTMNMTPPGGGTAFGGGGTGTGTGTATTTAPPVQTQPKRFHGSVVLDTTRVGRDASRIADEVIAHLAGLVGARVTVTLDVQAEIPSGAPNHVVRTVTENSRVLKFTSQGFERK